MAANPETGFRGRPSGDAGIDPDEENHYALLGVPFTASHAEILRAYRRAMKRVHPDRQRPERRSEAEDIARRLNTAYAVLANPVTKLAYDRTIRQQVIQDQIMRRYVGGFQSFEDHVPPAWAPRPEPTGAERRERAVADRRAALLLVLVVVGFTAVIVLLILFGAVLRSFASAVT